MASSEFYKDLSKVEKTYRGFSRSKIKVGFQLAGVVIITLGESFLVPDWAFFLVTLPTAALLGYVPVMKYLEKWDEYRRKIELSFIYEDSVYTTGEIRKYERDEFIQAKNISETQDYHQFGTSE